MTALRTVLVACLVGAILVPSAQAGRANKQSVVLTKKVDALVRDRATRAERPGLHRSMRPRESLNVAAKKMRSAVRWRRASTAGIGTGFALGVPAAVLPWLGAFISAVGPYVLPALLAIRGYASRKRNHSFAELVADALANDDQELAQILTDRAFEGVVEKAEKRKFLTGRQLTTTDMQKLGHLAQFGPAEPAARPAQSAADPASEATPSDAEIAQLEQMLRAAAVTPQSRESNQPGSLRRVGQPVAAGAR